MRLRRRRIFTTVLTDRRTVAQDTLEVSLARPRDFAFAAGQHLQVRVPTLLHADRRGPSRVFSIASSPFDEQHLRIAFRETGSGFKRTLRALEIGSELRIEGPHGFSTLPRDPARPVVLVAGGIGVTPYMSMLRGLHESHDDGPPITLLYGNRSSRTAAYVDELDDLARSEPQLTLRKHSGLMDEAAIRRSVEGRDSTWFVSGPPPMVDGVRSALHVLGVRASRVHVEEFLGY
ncbi:ferredoxin--NADP reductase [Cellulomonas fimi]|uniref:FAD-dependent oxidoreductase n=1 Tax=Cellulomonas fimi TaxID=1708 RepID=A0A7Y0LWQ2_CELFI|nr:FAD-dependent oxidoreductase [Cellulomonas fimi]NMR19314.1 FAD-dependent oxidoreductase [Cellulomonas fimi]